MRNEERKVGEKEEKKEFDRKKKDKSVGEMGEQVGREKEERKEEGRKARFEIGGRRRKKRN